MEKKLCPICGKQYYGWGNNARPLIADYCCDECNAKYVIPFRIGVITKEEVFVQMNN